jgi:oxygen-dependent protoporphyrinogen oxidase
MSFDVAVIGGGISGLTAAYHLQRRGRRVVVLERQVRPGGNAISERRDGFLMEHGPTTVNGAAPQASALSEALGLSGQRCELGPRVLHRYLADHRGLGRIATHPFGFLLSDYLTLPARLRLMAEILVPPRRGRSEETVQEFWQRRFGAELARRVVDPLVAGLFAGRAEELSMAATFPALIEMERRYGSVTQGVLRRRLAGGVMPARRLYSWREGIGTLPRALAGRLGGALRSGVAVRRVTPMAGGYRIETGRSGTLGAKSVILATQPHVAAGLLEGLDHVGAEAAGSIQAPPLAVVFLGYGRRQVAHPLDGLGYLTVERPGQSVSGTLFCSTIFPGRAPDGQVALAAYLGGARNPDLGRADPKVLVAAAREEFRDRLGARGEPVISRVRQWPRGLPQYRPGHLDRVAALESVELRCPGLFLAGNYFSGPAVAACVARAGDAAARAEGYLLGLGRDASRSVEAQARITR